MRKWVAGSAVGAVVLALVAMAPAQATETCTMMVTAAGTTVYGTPDADVICVSGDNNTIYAMGGDDTVVDTGTGNYFDLGDGADSYDGSGGIGSDVDGGPGPDYITGTPGDDTVSGGSGADSIVGGYGADSLNGGDDNDTLAGGDGADQLWGDAGTDTLTGGDGSDTLGGGIADDTLVGGAMDDTLYGGDGADNLSGDAGADSIYGEAGPDTLTGGDGSDSLDGGEGSDTITGGIADDTIVGGYGDDTLSGGDGNDRLAGEAGADTIYGEAGTDLLTGGADDDVVVGGEGIDEINAGAGLNTCDFTTGEVLTATCVYDDEPPTFSAVIDQSSVDSGTTSPRIDATITSTDTSGVSTGYMVCSAPAGVGHIFLGYERSRTGTFTFYDASGAIAADSWSGNTRSVTARLHTTLPQGSTPATYQCWSWTMDAMGNQRPTAIMSGTSFSVTRSGDGFDDDPPLFEVQLAQTTVETGYERARLDFTLSASDATGLYGGSVACVDPKSLSDQVVGFNVDENGNFTFGDRGGPITADSLVGDGRAFTAHVHTYLPVGARPGTWTCSTYSRDTIGNQALGAYLSFQATRSVYFDDSPPSVSVSVAQTTVDSGAQSPQLDFTITASDETAVKRVYTFCNDPTMNSGVFVPFYFGDDGRLNAADEAVMTGDQKSLVFRMSVPLAQGSKPGLYSCRVSTEDTLGNTDYVGVGSLFTVTRTPPGMPGAVSGVTFTPTDGHPTEGSLSWLAPEFLGSPELVDYQVEYSLDGSTWVPVADDTSTSTSSPIRNLQVDTTYRFRVRADNGGNSLVGSLGAPWSDPITVTTPVALVSDAPTALGVSSVTTSGARLDWTAPAYNGGVAVTDYRVETLRDGGSWTEVPHPASTSTSMTLSGLAPGTTYQVRVAAKNSVGYSNSVSASLTTAGSVPTAPENLRSSSVSSSTLTLNWDLPTSNGGLAITDYRIEFSSNGGSTWNPIVHAPSNALGFNVTSLTPGVGYQFRVSAINALGTGTASGVHSVSTPPVVPNAPTNLTFPTVTGTTATLNWQAPTYNGGAAISDYRVETLRSGDTVWNEIAHAATTLTSFSLGGLAPGTTYQVRVSAKNTAGFSPYLTGSFATPTTVPTAPSNLTSTNVASSTLTLAWDLPASNGGSPITDYRIEFSSNGGSTWSAINHAASTARTFNVTGLTPGVSYRFRVSALNALGAGPASANLTVSTLPVVPAAPTNFSATSIAATSVTLGWVAPTNTGGAPISDYKVELSRDNGTTWAIVPHAASASTSMGITGLQPGSSYRARISALNSAGYSSPLAGNFSTPTTVASAVQNLAVGTTTATSVQLSWTAPASNGGAAITDYRVEYSTTGTTWTVIPHTAFTTPGFTATGLLGSTNYSFRVSAVTSVGVGTSATIGTTTAVPVAPGPPTSLSMKVTTSAYTLSWLAPSNNGGAVIADYVVEIASYNATTATWSAYAKITKAASSSTSLALSGLLAKSTYRVRVSAVNGAGLTSTPSTPLSFTTK